MSDIIFNSALGRASIGAHVKDWTYDQLKEAFEGKLDYKSLAKQLGIKPVKAPKVEPKEVEKPSESKDYKSKK